MAPAGRAGRSSLDGGPFTSNGRAGWQSGKHPRQGTMRKSARTANQCHLQQLPLHDTCVYAGL